MQTVFACELCLTPLGQLRANAAVRNLTGKQRRSVTTVLSKSILCKCNRKLSETGAKFTKAQTFEAVHRSRKSSRDTNLEKRERHRPSLRLAWRIQHACPPKKVSAVEKQLGIKTGETTPDLKFTLETVNCVGACALGPMVIIGEDYHGEMTPQQVNSVLKNYK